MNKEKKIAKFQPKSVQRIVCPKCGELQMKIYPWSSYKRMDDKPISLCQKCLNKLIKS